MVAIGGFGVGFVVIAVAAVVMREMVVVGRIDDGGSALDFGVMFLEWALPTRKAKDR